MAEFLMPMLGADMSAGTLVAWKKREGDRVTRGEIVAEVETEKAAIDVEIFVTGVLEKILVPPGEKVPVGTVLALVREDHPARGARQEARGGEQEHPLAPSPAPPARESAGRRRISPAARQLAADLGVDPARVPGTGPEGAITRDDVLRAGAGGRPAVFSQGPGDIGAAQAEGPAAQGPPDQQMDRQARIRQAIAAAMTRSKREIPHYYLGTTIAMARALAWLAEDNLRRPVADRVLPGVLFLKAVALALREVPELNALWKEGRAVTSRAIHVGVAISLRGGGLVAPALHDADRSSLTDLMRAFRDLVARARAGSLRSSELSDPTITVTSLGEQGVEAAYGIIYPPQVALVGFGKIVERPWVEEGRIVARPVVTATLSADHRVTDGHRGGLFLAAVDRLLQEPERL